MKILLLGKQRDDFYFKKLVEFSLANTPDIEIVLAQPGEVLPKNLMDWKGDYLISYLCPWVIPGPMLQNARIAAINFHPAPPEYPGTGCTNFAIYNRESSYGVTCHHMDEKVDSGRIVAVRRFSILENDTVFSLTQRCYAYMLSLYYDIFSIIVEGQKLPVSDETWTRQPYRRKELNGLKRIDPSMPVDEIRRRIKAVTYPGTPGAYIEVEGMRFEYNPDYPSLD